MLLYKENRYYINDEFNEKIDEIPFEFAQTMIEDGFSVRNID